MDFTDAYVVRYRAAFIRQSHICDGEDLWSKENSAAFRRQSYKVKDAKSQHVVVHLTGRIFGFANVASMLSTYDSVKIFRFRRHSSISKKVQNGFKNSQIKLRYRFPLKTAAKISYEECPSRIDFHKDFTSENGLYRIKSIAQAGGLSHRETS